MNRALEGAAREISRSLARELGTRHVSELSEAPTLDVFVRRIVEEVVARDGNASRAEIARGAAGLNVHSPDDDDDDDRHARSRLPNLKYAKPKYKDVESVLKYIEADQDSGGVKLVIMNFND